MSWQLQKVSEIERECHMALKDIRTFPRGPGKLLCALGFAPFRTTVREPDGLLAQDYLPVCYIYPCPQVQILSVEENPKVRLINALKSRA